MTTAELLASHDRCPRLAHWSRNWESNRLHPRKILQRAIEVGLTTDESDPGQAAGDHVMTLCSERGLDVADRSTLYSTAMNVAALADIAVTSLRSGGPWAHPEDRMVKSINWVSSAFVEPSGVRLRRILCADRYNDERKLAESHSWYTLGECSVYQLPMTTTVLLVGQFRDGKFHSPWSKGWLHPKSRCLRIAKRSGEKFDGNWVTCWREEQENISRDKWLDAMRADGVMNSCLFDVEVPVPDPSFQSKIGHLAERKMEAITGTTEVPPPNISVCDWPTRCEFADACWSFSEPSEKLGYIQISTEHPL